MEDKIRIVEGAVMKKLIDLFHVRVSRFSGPMVLAASFIIGGYSPAALAQPAGALEEVVVTARKREESLQDTPLAVSSFDAESLRADGVANVTDLVKFVPGVSNKDGARYSGLAIRGVGSRVSGANATRSDPGVGVYVDGVFMPRSDTQLVEVIEVESIQVLRGPQGTLFGKNTAGGALLMTSAKPQDEFAGFVDVNLGDYDRQYFRGGVSGPLGDRLLGGIVVQSRTEDGYMDDAVNGRDYGNIDRKAVVGQLRWLPTDSLTVDLLAMWSKQDERAAPTSCHIVNPAAQVNMLVLPGLSGTVHEACQASDELEEREEVTLDSIGSRWGTTNTLVALTANWEISQNLALRSISGYLEQDDILHSFDADATNVLHTANPRVVAEHFVHSGIDVPGETQEFFSQEFDLIGSALDDRLRYTVGVFGSVEKIDNFLDGTSLAPSGWAGFPIAGGALVFVLPPTRSIVNLHTSDFENESLAGFGQLIYEINDNLQLTVGGRYTWEKKSVDLVNYVTSNQSPGVVPRPVFDALANTRQPLIVNPALPGFSDKETWTDFTPMATLSWTWPDLEGSAVDEAMVYVTYSEGFKAGGFSRFFGEVIPFDPEELTTYEFGFKLDMLDRRMRLNAALYTSSYDEMQLLVNRQSVTQGSRLPLTGVGVTNAASADISGAELEMTLVPVDGLYIRLTGGYIDASYDEFVDLRIVDGVMEFLDRSHEDFTFIPEQTYSLVVQYDWQTPAGTLSPRISGSYRDGVYFPLNVGADIYDDAYLDSYSVWNARLTFQPEGMENLSVAVYSDNVTDEHYYGTGTGETITQGSVSRVTGRPRTYGVTVRYEW